MSYKFSCFTAELEEEINLNKKPKEKRARKIPDVIKINKLMPFFICKIPIKLIIFMKKIIEVAKKIDFV